MNHYRKVFQYAVSALSAVLFSNFPLQASELYSLLRPDTEAVIHLNLQKVRSHITTPAGKELQAFYGITQSLLPAGKEVDSCISDAVFSFSSLRKNRFTVFYKTTLPEQEFRALLEKHSQNIRFTTRMCGTVRIYRIREKGREEKSLFAAYAAKDVILFSETDPSGYFLDKSSPKGLTGKQRSFLKKEYFLSGFLSPDKKFYRKNPFFPRFALLTFYASIGKDSSLTIHMEGTLRKGEDPAGKLQQAQQTRLMLALLLNNIDPALAEEFINSGNVYEHNNTLILRQYLSASLLKKIFLQGIPVMMQQNSTGNTLPASKRKVHHP